MIRKVGSQFCLFTHDGSKKLGCHDTKAGAEAQERAVMVSKYAQFRGAVSGELRTATYDGRDHVVVPVVALVEGVLKAMNSDKPELVLAQEFSRSPHSWNGRPVMPHHPAVDGKRVSANDPRILEGRLGRVFNTRVLGKKLLMDAYLDPERAADVVERLNAGKQIEVSIGVFVSTEEREGRWNGQAFSRVWHDLVPDHLAMLPEGIPGACSIADGCGAPRAAASSYSYTDPMSKEAKTHVEELMKKGMPKDKAVAMVKDQAKKNMKAMSKGLTEGGRMDVEQLADLILQFRPSQAQEMSDMDFREELQDTLRATVPGFIGVDSVYPETSQVVYACVPGHELEMWRVSFTKEPTGAIMLGDDAEQVEKVTQFMPVGSYEEGRAASSCGCGKPKDSELASTEEGDAMDPKKAARVKALMAKPKSPFKKEDEAGLLTLSDEALTCMEAHAEDPEPEPEPEPKPEPKPEEVKVEAPKVLSEDDYLAQAPDSIKEIVENHKKVQATKRVTLISGLKAAQGTYSEDELKAMSVDQLEKLDTLVKAQAPKKDFSGAGAPRAAASEDDNKAPKPIDMAERIRDMAAKKVKAS